MAVAFLALPLSALSGQPGMTRRHFGVLAGSTLAASPIATSAALPYQSQPGFKLNTGAMFPTASFGLQVYDDDTAQKLTTVALDLGYRNFFASVLAGNQRGFAKAIKQSGIAREDLFICGSVLSNRVQGFDGAYKLSQRGCKENMEAFAVGGLDYIDMIMLDYPGPDDDSIRGQWKALEDMAKAGLTRSLAVSNFSPRQLDALSGSTTPSVNQLPYGVGFSSYYDGNAAAIIEQNQKRGVLVQAWSPLRRALSGRAKSACAEIGQKYGKSAAQVGLRWIADTGVAFTTQTKSRDHFAEDLDIFDFTLTKDEVATLAAI